MLLFPSSKPIRNIKNETTRALMYSILPWPNGCSSSTGLLASFAPKIVTMFELASERLLTASAVIETEFVTLPTTNLSMQSIMLQNMPTIPEAMPKRSRSFASVDEHPLENSFNISSLIFFPSYIIISAETVI